jgi:hypothetical protein
MKFTATLVLLVGIAGGLSCGDTSGPPKPTPGTLRFDLTSPNSDGALLLHLSGPAAAAAAVTAANNAHQLYARAAPNGGVNVALFGSVGAGPLLRIQVQDVSRAAEYQVTFIEAADAGNALRTSVSGYSGQFVKD